MSPPAAQVERGVAADACLRLHVGRRRDQELGDLGVAALGRPVQRGHAVAPGRVHVRALIEERPDGLRVSLPRGLDEFDDIGRGGGACQDHRDAQQHG